MIIWIIIVGLLSISCAKKSESKIGDTGDKFTESKDSPEQKEIWEEIESINSLNLHRLDELFYERLPEQSVVEDPTFWITLANDSNRVPELRRLAMVAFFDRHFRAGDPFMMLARHPGVVKWFEEGVLVSQCLEPLAFPTEKLVRQALPGSSLWPPDLKSYRNTNERSFIECRNWYTFIHPILGAHPAPNNSQFMRQVAPPVRRGPASFILQNRVRFGRRAYFTTIQFMLSASVPPNQLIELLKGKRNRVGTSDVWGAWNRWAGPFKEVQRMVLPDCLAANELRVMHVCIDQRRNQATHPEFRLRELRERELFIKDLSMGDMVDQLNRPLRPGYKPPSWDKFVPWPVLHNRDKPADDWIEEKIIHGFDYVEQVKWWEDSFGPSFLRPRKSVVPFNADHLPFVLKKIQANRGGGAKTLSLFDAPLDRLPVGEDGSFWLEMVGDKERDHTLRRRCAAAFLRRHLRPGMTADRLAEIPWKKLAIGRDAKFHDPRWMRAYGAWGKYSVFDWPTLDGGIGRCRVIVLLGDCVVYLSFAHEILPVDLIAAIKNKEPWLTHQKLAGVHVYEPERRPHFQMALEWAWDRGPNYSATRWLKHFLQPFGKRPHEIAVRDRTEGYGSDHPMVRHSSGRMADPIQRIRLDHRTVSFRQFDNLRIRMPVPMIKWSARDYLRGIPSGFTSGLDPHMDLTQNAPFNKHLPGKTLIPIPRKMPSGN